MAQHGTRPQMLRGRHAWVRICVNPAALGGRTNGFENRVQRAQNDLRASPQTSVSDAQILQCQSQSCRPGESVRIAGRFHARGDVWPPGPTVCQSSISAIPAQAARCLSIELPAPSKSLGMSTTRMIFVFLSVDYVSHCLLIIHLLQRASRPADQRHEMVPSFWPDGFMSKEVATCSD